MSMIITKWNHRTKYDNGVYVNGIHIPERNINTFHNMYAIFLFACALFALIIKSWKCFALL